jgi:hypothetical protein
MMSLGAPPRVGGGVSVSTLPAPLYIPTGTRYVQTSYIWAWDAAFAELLIELAAEVRVAAALADNPDEVLRIAGLKQEDRAIALGKYAAATKRTARTSTGLASERARKALTRRQRTAS